MPANQSTPEVTRALKPCPKCDDVGELRTSSDGEVAWVRCALCRHEGPLGYSTEEAVAGWNAGLSRAATPARGGDELREALKKAADEFDLILARLRDHQPERAEGAAICGAKDARKVLASTDMAGAEKGKDANGNVDARDGDRAGVREPDAVANGHGQLGGVAPPVEGLTSGEGDAAAAAMREAAVSWLEASAATSRSKKHPADHPLSGGMVDGMLERYATVYEEAAKAIGSIPLALAASPKATATASVREWDEGAAYCNKCGFYGIPEKHGLHLRPGDRQHVVGVRTPNVFIAGICEPSVLAVVLDKERRPTQYGDWIAVARWVVRISPAASEPQELAERRAAECIAGPCASERFAAGWRDLISGCAST